MARYCNSTAFSTLPDALDNLNPSPEIAFIERDSGIYTGSRNFETTTEALDSISNPANWETSDTALIMPTGSFSFTTTAVGLSDFSAETEGESAPWWMLVGLVIVPVIIMVVKRPKRNCCN